MNYLRIVVPAIVTAGLTAGIIFLARWITGLVPEGEWAALIRAILVLCIVLGTLLIIAWSAYFTHAIRKSMKE
jgi:ABC-type transport system involved in cytochrome bd biosynthesis fused ATPase/permease subunit